MNKYGLEEFLLRKLNLIRPFHYALLIEPQTL